MAYWLYKSEPDTWSWDMQVKKGKKGQEWDGVRNYTARNHMRAMKKGDRGFFYHSGDEKAVVGIVEVVAEAHPDSTDDTGKWDCVDIAAVERTSLDCGELGDRSGVWIVAPYTGVVRPVDGRSPGANTCAMSRLRGTWVSSTSTVSKPYV